MRQEVRPFFNELLDILNAPLFHIQRTPVTLISFIGAILFLKTSEPPTGGGRRPEAK